MSLSGKTIVITGALGVLGRAVCQQLVANGGNVIALDRVSDNPPEGVTVAPPVDLGDAQAVKDAISKMAAEHGPFYGLINIAGGFSWELIESGAIDTWDALYQINVRTAVNTCQAILPHMESAGGRIVNISAAAAVKADLGLGAYAASKSAVSRLTESLAEELKARDITVNAVMPSIIDTPANRKDMPDADYATWVTPASLANVIGFLVSAEASAVTGALIPVIGRV